MKIKNQTHNIVAKVNKPATTTVGKIATEEKIETEKIKKNNSVFKSAIIFLSATTAVIIATLSLNKFLGYNITQNAWYWIGLAAAGIIFIIGWSENRLTTAPISVIAKICLAMALIMAIVYAIWPESEKGIAGNKSATPAAQPAILQITPQILEGWEMKDGCLTVNLRPEQEVARTFQLGGGYSTPCIIIPDDEYRVRFDHNQTIMINDDGRKAVIHPQEKYNGGVTAGERRIKFTALASGADIFLAIKRLEKKNT